MICLFRLISCRIADDIIYLLKILIAYRKGVFNMKKRLIILIVIIIAIVICIVGCMLPGSPEDKNDGSEKETVKTEKKADNDLIIGTKTDSKDAYIVELTNLTGHNIKYFTVRDNTQTSYPGNMLPSGKIFYSSETRTLYYLPEKAGSLDDMDEEELTTDFYEEDQEIDDQDKDDSESASNTKKDKKSRFDLVITLDNGNRKTIKGFPFDDTDKAEIYLDSQSDELYIIYNSKKTHKRVNTLTQKEDEEIIDDDDDDDETEVIDEDTETEKTKENEKKDTEKKTDKQDNKKPNEGGNKQPEKQDDPEKTDNPGDKPDNSGIIDEGSNRKYTDDEVLN